MSCIHIFTRRLPALLHSPSPKVPPLERQALAHGCGGADVWHDPAFLTEDEADALLADAEDWRFTQERVRVFGKEHDVPRLTAWFADAGLTYTYSGLALSPQPFPPCLNRLRRRIEAATALTFNSALANLYRDGRDKMGWHADDERELGDAIHIASVSLGAKRTFHMRAKANRRRTYDIELAHGSLLVMRHPTQRHWEHCLPARARARGQRLNLTFRRIFQ